MANEDDIEKRSSEPLAQALGSSFASNLRKLRKGQRLSQERLAYMIGTERPRISNLERSVAEPRLSDIAKLARALDVSPVELIDLAAFHPRDYPLPGDGHARP